MVTRDPKQNSQALDVIVVGAGFAGIRLLYRLRKAGFRAKVLERGSGIGGVWFWNRYPGARCDVESLEYSYAFSEDLQRYWTWSERFSTQPEILAYLEHVVERFDLVKDIVLNQDVSRVQFDQGRSSWTLDTVGGAHFEASFVVMATGALSASRLPNIPGIETFAGRALHTARWPHEGVDFRGRRVAVIGTGSSGVQSIPLIAEQAAHLYVLQRTPSYSVPARNAPLNSGLVSRWKSEHDTLRFNARSTRSGVLHDYGTKRAAEVNDGARRSEYEARWKKGGPNFLYAFTDIIRDRTANETAASFVRERIAEIVKDPLIAKLLTPVDYPIGTKRVCVDTDYYETFNRPNVSLVDVRAAPIERIEPEGIITADRTVIVDDIVFATGFDAMTGALLAMDIRGVEGRSLRDSWAAGPYTYLGLMTSGFPNLFIVTGPGSPSVLSNMVLSIEHDADWIGDCLEYLRKRRASRIEVDPETEQDWMHHVGELAAQTLYPLGNSWYLGANVPGKPRVFMPYLGGVDTYQRICAQIAAEGYRGFRIAASVSPDATRTPK